MASETKLSAQIAEIIARPHNVAFEEIENILNRIGCHSRQAKHGLLFRFQDGKTLMLNRHNDGRTKLPRYCVIQFRDAMIRLGYFDA